MFRKRLSLFSLWGFEVRIDMTWLFLALLVAWSLAEGWFPAQYKGFSEATYWWMGLVGVFGLFASIVFHELCHSLVARHYGLPMGGITLFLFGGMAEMQEEPQSPKVEFWMAIAGPISSLVLAGLFYALAASLSDTAEGAAISPVAGVVLYLAFLNVLLAVFNMIPAFPLDGGRVLRAALWHWKGDLRWATRRASQAGVGFSFVLMGLGLLSVLKGNLLGGFWWFLIGMFLRMAATSSYYQLIMRRSLEGEPVRRFMTPDPVAAPADISVRRFLDDYVYRYYHDFFPVVADGALTGCVHIRQLKAVPREKWDSVTVADLAQACSETNSIDADADAVKALARMQQAGVSRMMVTENGRLAGIIALKDLMRLLALKIDLEEAA